MIKVLYVGDDNAYFEHLKKRFQKESDEEFEFKHLWHEDEDTFHRLSAEVVHQLPNIAFLDFSSHPVKMMTVARSLPRLFERGASLIGLWHKEVKETHYKESFTIGVPFNHFKSPEFSDIVAQALFLYKDSAFPEGEFAKAEVMKIPLEIECTSIFRIGYMTEKYLHVEHDFYVPEDKEIRLKHHFGDSFPVNKFKVVRRLDSNYYYEMNYVSDLEYVYLEPENPVSTEGKTKSDKKKAFWKDRSRQESLLRKKAKVQKYVEDHTGSGQSKRTRILVIDPSMKILEQASKPLDTYPYSIRTYRSLHKERNLLKRIMPGILCYQCPDEDEGELGEIMTEIESIDGFNPYLVVFKSKQTSEKLQERFGYSRILTWGDEFSFKQLLHFCETYEKRLGRDKTHDTRVSFHDKEKRYYISKSQRESFMEYPFTIELKAACEVWLKFQTEEDLTLWSILHIKKPVPLSFTIIEKLDERDWAKPGFHQYRGVIHGLGETDRANMRREINQMIYNEKHFKEEKEEDKDKDKNKEKK